MKNVTLLLTFSAVLVLAPAARGQNNVALRGDYAFSFTGMTTGNGITSTPFAAVGRFTADGLGNLTNGELDSNGVGPMEKAVALAFTGSYSIGADNRGVMNLNIPGGGKLAFAMMSNGNAKFVEIDASGGHGTVGSGTMEKVDTTAFNTARIVGDYAFGVAGQEQSNTSRTAIAGRFTANGAGMLTNGAADANQNGTFTTLNLLAGTYAVTDSATGRGVANLPPVIGGALPNLDFVFYVVNSGKLFIMDVDAVSPASPLLNGTVLQQQTPAGGFTNGSMNSGMVIYLTGTASPGGSGCGGAGLLTGDGLGALTLTYDQNCGAGTVGVVSGTYSVSSGGRAALRPGTEYVVAYLVTSNEGFILAPDRLVSFGFGEPQAQEALTTSSVVGTYAGATSTPNSATEPIFSGEFTADGAGTIVGTIDIGAPSGPGTETADIATYSVSSSPTNGRGWTTSGNGILYGPLYVISPSKFVVVSMAVAIFEK